MLVVALRIKNATLLANVLFHENITEFNNQLICSGNIIRTKL